MDATAPTPKAHTPAAPGPKAPSREASGREAARTEEPCSPYDVFARHCPSRQTLEHVTGRWGSLTLTAISDSTVRFNELRRRVDGVSEKMLSQTLHALERDGLVNRRSQGTNPPRVDYCLTPLGHDVVRRLRELFDLVEGRMPEVLAAREAYDARGGR
ncbi:helix-turn-helix domain-containing protein [Streptomyces sp. ICBB 8177]|uniref:winged helix-turn-helix transcriptional regulator n=1 Tax=Streptomyces sp. ICBB 8177 TaxID=563922 RepID=UPI000D684479|nr:helix-turn-helix domain-containing protein [Streptomyces sp. ICBB 8177]PWI44278.1 transcriptional regulator [Streptomyces sp. ICBB 8177]